MNKFEQMERGKALFFELTDTGALEEEKDAFVLVLTDTEEIVQAGIRYLPDYIAAYGYRAHVYSALRTYNEAFTKAGGTVHGCASMQDVHTIATYFMLFGQRDHIATEFVFLTEKNDFGSRADGLLAKGEVTAEQYVRCSLYTLPPL